MWDFRITNIAGIRSGEATIEAGLNVVQASNFMGKSSFVGAIQTIAGTSGMYGEAHPLTEGTEKGAIQLDTGEESYEVNLTRGASGTVTRQGTPLLTDETDQTCARLFAFLGENNPIRARVRNGEDVTDLLMAPLDIEDIDEQIEALKQQRASVDRRLQEAQQAASNIPSVKEAIHTLESELAELREQRETVAQRVSEEDSGDDGLSDELADKRRRLTTAEQTVSRLANQLERTEARLEEKRAELDDIEIPDGPAVTADMAETEARIDDLALQIDLLEGLHRANQRVLEEDELDLVSTVDRSFIEDEVECWVCGTATTAQEMQARLDALQERLESLREERATLQDEITEMEAAKRRLEEKRQKKGRLEEQIGNLTADLDEVRGELQQAKERRSRLESEVEALEAQLEEAEESLSEELTDVKAEIRTREAELADQRSRLDELEGRREQADELAAEAEQLSAELTALRNRKTEKQWEIKEQFDAAMADAIDRFAPGFDGARLDVKTTEDNEIESFDLVIAREGRETDIANLSEGEQELVGIVVAVAGHRTFDVADRVPAVVLDGISQLSAENLRRLTGYFEDISEILVTTAYPEAGEFGGNRISPESWETVSDEEAATA